MKHSIYVRPDLDATRMGQADPKRLIASGIKRLKCLLETPEKELSQQSVRGLFALYLRMQRVRPELIRQVENGQEVMEKVSRRIKRDPGHYAKRAMESIDLQKWKQEADKLFEMSESLDEPAEEADLGEEVLNSLDEADLIFQGALEAGCKDTKLATGLAECNQWLASNSELFLSCGTKVQRAALSFYEELPQTNPKLARTSRKYVAILDELEVARKELRWEGQLPLDPVAIKALLKS